MEKAAERREKADMKKKEKAIISYIKQQRLANQERQRQEALSKAEVRREKPISCE
jgi:hypothetical protein